MARRAAGWNRISYCSGSVPGQVLPDGGQVGAGLTAAERGQALGDAGDRLGVAEDFQGHLQAFQVVHGN